MNAPIATIQRLKQSFQKGKMYVFVVTNERNESGCQIVQDRQGVRHLLTGTRKSFTPGKSIRLEVKGYSHSPSKITGSYYLVLSPPAPKESSSKKEPYSGKVIKPPKNKLTGFGPKFLKKKYSVGERYLFYVTGDLSCTRFTEVDVFQINTIPHLSRKITATAGASEWLSTLMLIQALYFFDPKEEDGALDKGDAKANIYIKQNTDDKLTINDATTGLWEAPITVTLVDKTTASYTSIYCYRVDLKDIYFCKPCARQIFETKPRRTEPSIIYTPMGNKR